MERFLAVPLPIVISIVVMSLGKVPPVMDKSTVSSKGKPWGTSTTAMPTVISFRVTFKGKGFVVFPCAVTATRFASPLKSPLGSSVKELLAKNSISRLLSGLNIPEDSSVKALLPRDRVTRLVRSSNMSVGRVLRELLVKSRVIRAIRPTKSPDFRAEIL